MCYNFKMNRTRLKKIGIGVFLIVAICLSLTGVLLLGLVFNSYRSLPASNNLFDRGAVESQAVPTVQSNLTMPQKVELIFDGKGTQELRFLVEHGGVYVFATNHTGDGEFTIVIKDSADQVVGSGASCEDDCADYRVVTLVSGEYVMQIESDGWWLIRAQLISP